jgi:thioredoxin-related protein
MSNNTFKNEEIGKIVNANWVAYKLDCEKGEGPALAAKAKITAYPTLVFYDSQGNEIGRKMGYMDPAAFKPVLEEMLQKVPKTKPVKGNEKSGNQSGANFNDFMKEKESVMNPLEERVFGALGKENFLLKTKELAKIKDDFAYEDLEVEITQKLGRKAAKLYNFLFWTEMKKYDRAKEWMNSIANENPDADQLHLGAWLFLKHEQIPSEAFRWINESIRLKPVPEAYETKAAMQFLANRNEDGLETIKSAIKIKPEPRFQILKAVFENQPSLGKK